MRRPQLTGELGDIPDGQRTRDGVGNGLRRRTVCGLVPILLACGISAACDTVKASSSDRPVRIATGLPEMTFSRLGQEMAQAFRGQMPGVSFVAVETPGSVRNIELLHQGGADVALSLADAAYLAYSGESRRIAGATRGVRGIAVLHHSRVHVLVAPRSNIQSISDLRGRTIAIGPDGSGTAETSQLLLSAFGVPLSSVRLRSLPFASGSEALARGEVQAAIVVAADPVDAVIRATRSGARILDIDGPNALRVRTQYPFLRADVIQPGTYTGQDHTVRTLSVDVLLLCREDLDTELVRHLTATLFAVLPDLATRLRYLKHIDLGRAAATPIPLHPGAAWYYREQELAR
jgi:TRAP transporter TAXI family solute receptor